MYKHVFIFIFLNFYGVLLKWKICFLRNPTLSRLIRSIFNAHFQFYAVDVLQPINGIPIAFYITRSLELIHLGHRLFNRKRAPKTASFFRFVRLQKNVFALMNALDYFGNQVTTGVTNENSSVYRDVSTKKFSHRMLP